MNIYTIKPLTEEIIAKFVPTRLYIKRHSKTGLKYFGKYTKEDIFAYNGSGVHWCRHLDVHGKEDVITDWVSDWYTDPHEIQKVALEFSRENDIVYSDNWANMVPENGLDGGPNNIGKANVKDNLGNTFQVPVDDPDYVSGRVVACQTGFVNARNPETNIIHCVPVTDENYVKGIWRHMSVGIKLNQSTCEWCGFTGGGGNMSRYHHANCDKNPANANRVKQTAPCRYCGTEMLNEYGGPGLRAHETYCELNPDRDDNLLGRKIMDLVSCEHCGQKVSSNNVPNHVNHCEMNPNRETRVFKEKQCPYCEFTAPGNTLHWHIKKCDYNPSKKR